MPREEKKSGPIGPPLDAPSSAPSTSKHVGPRRSSPYPTERLSSAIKLVDVAGEIERADTVIASRVGGELEVIAGQIRALQAQAQQVLERASRDQQLHRAECRFARHVGHIYHLYARDDGRTILSAISPDEWGANPPHSYVGSYRLEGDQSWTPVADIDPSASTAFERAQAILDATTAGQDEFSALPTQRDDS